MRPQGRDDPEGDPDPGARSRRLPGRAGGPRGPDAATAPDRLAQHMTLADQSAWVQAHAPSGAVTTALIAVAVSIWSVLRQGRADRRRERLRGGCLAVSIIPGLHEIEAAVDHAADIIHRHLGWHLASKCDEIADTLRKAVIEVPLSLAQNVSDLWLLGSAAGPTALQLVDATRRRNNFIHALADLVAAGKMNNVLEAVPEIDERLQFLRRVITKAKIEIGRLHP